MAILFGMRFLRSDDAVRAAARRLEADLSAPGLGKAVAAYYTDPAFAGMTFSNLGRNPRDAITADDLLAVSLLDITWRPEVVRVVLGRRSEGLSALLAGVPGGAGGAGPPVRGVVGAAGGDSRRCGCVGRGGCGREAGRCAVGCAGGDRGGG